MDSMIWLVAGLMLLAGGAEVLVRGATRLAGAAGVSPLVVGMTVVAYGTSTPELTVSVDAAWRGAADLALGNVVGSNIFNVLCILGLSAMAAPLVVSSQVVRREVPVMIAASALLMIVVADGTIGRWDGALFLGALVLHTAMTIRMSRRETRDVQAEFADGLASGKRSSVWVGVGLAAAGLAVLVLGTRWVVESAVALAHVLGVSDLVIGLTVIAAGTSLPELATSLVAALRGQRDIAVGNVVGSNIFNIFAILGTAAIISPIAVADAALWFDIPVMAGVALACLPVFLSHHRISRAEGMCLLIAYVAYTVYLGLDATAHEQLPAYRRAVTVVMLPLLTVGVLEALGRSPSVWAWNRRR